MPIDEHIAQLLQDVASINSKLDIMHTRLFGNGQPGVISQMEDKIDSQGGFIKWLTGVGTGIMSLFGLFEYLYHRK